jgi:predicted DNA-binding transcriptional regulator YafY
MRFLLFLSSAFLVLGLAGISLLVAYVEWIHAQHNFWAIRNPFFHIQVLLTLLTTPLFWIFLGAWVLGYYSMLAIEKREVRARQNILRNVEQRSGEVKSAAFLFPPQGEFKQIHESIEQKIRTIQEALGKGQKIDFGYEKHNGQLSDRIVTPFRLTNLGQNPSLEGYCHLKESNRVFLVAGMSDITIISPRKNSPQQQFTPQSAQPSRRDYALSTSDAHSISDRPELVDRNVRASEISPGSPSTRLYMRCRIDELKKTAYENWIVFQY